MIPTASVLKEIQLSEPILNVHEFHSAFRFIGWTPSGNILQIHLGDNEIHQHLVWERSEKKQFLAAVFIPPDPVNHFAAIDCNSVLQVYSLQTKDEVCMAKDRLEKSFEAT